MLRITEQTATRLVLHDTRPGASAAALAFTLLSTIALLFFCWQALQALATRDTRSTLWLFNLFFYMLLGMGMVALGIISTVNLGRGMRCIFDKKTETVTVSGMFRRVVAQHSIYGISQLEVEANTALQSYGVFLVLRSGQRIPLTVAHTTQQDHIQALIKQVRQFLWT